MYFEKPCCMYELTYLHNEEKMQFERCRTQKKIFRTCSVDTGAWHFAPVHRGGKLIHSTVELGIKNRQNKNQLGFKSQIVDDRLHIYVLNHRQNKNKLDFKNQKLGDQNCS